MGSKSTLRILAILRGVYGVMGPIKVAVGCHCCHLLSRQLKLGCNS